MTAPSPSLPLVIDSTMMSCFRQCPQKFFNEFCNNLRPAALSIDLHAGGCFAFALEQVYRNFYGGATLDKALLHAYAAFLDRWGNFVPNKETPKTPDNVWKAIEEYFKLWSPETDEVQPYLRKADGSFEFTFSLPLEPSSDPYGYTAEGDFPKHPSGAPFIYAGRFDMLGTWHGRPIVRDEKTTTSIGVRWAEQWNLRSQFMGYVWACQQSGLDLDTVCIRGIGILKTKTHLVEAFKTYSKAKVARWHEQLRRDMWRMRRMWDDKYFDFNFADACSSYGGCPFMALCESEHPERWYSQFQQRNWNPLLKNPIETGEKAA